MAHTYLLTGPYTFARAERERFLADLRERGPRYVVMVRVPSSLSEFAAGAVRLAREADVILRDEYVLEREFPRAEDPAAASASAGAPGVWIQVFRRKEP